MNEYLNIGLFGFGVVGGGVYQILNQTPGIEATVSRICIRNPGKPRQADPSLFTDDPDVILNDPTINLVVELIDDADAAFRIVKTALKKGKAVVSANKKMIAEKLPEILALQKNTGSPFLYEAAVCGSIPIIRNLEEYYDNDLLRGICGIVNGSTNFILTRICQDKLDFSQSLVQAQQSGFAETDPLLDISGADAASKLTILLAHAYGLVTKPEQLLKKGISSINNDDRKLGEGNGWRLKLLAQAYKLKNGKIAALILPQYLEPDHQLFHVNDEYNGVLIESSLADRQFLFGKGAGRFPTTSAVISDISALRYHYRYEYRKIRKNEHNELTTDYFLRIYVNFPSGSSPCFDTFEWIEETRSNQRGYTILGVISARELLASSWLENQNISIVLAPDGIIENIDTVKARKRSLELAGVAI